LNARGAALTDNPLLAKKRICDNQLATFQLCLIRQQEDIQMIKLRNFWSNDGEDTLLVSGLLLLFLGLYLLLAYLMIRF
jgi:hypothetical protein